ncbi:MAG: nucleotide exchange factor GrpE [Bdellovibrionales bacterium]|nr:nucleotide exchange factor GrpE [Bdellovibrionales bacterium]
MSDETTTNADNEETSSEGQNTEVVNDGPIKAGEDFKAKYYYLAAEFDNSRKRFEREKENLIKYGNEKVLTNLITVIDNFELTVNALKNDNDDKVQNIVKGIDMIRNQFLDVLKKNGLTEIESLGKQFDPNFHEAVAQAPAPGKEDQEVITEYQRGYVLNGRLLRAAKVVVANNG